MLFWVRNLPLFSGLCKWDVTRYIYNLGIFSSIFNIFQFLHYSKRQQSYFLLNCNHQRSKMTSLKTICPLLIKIFSNISEQPWMGVMIMLQVNDLITAIFSCNKILSRTLMWKVGCQMDTFNLGGHTAVKF